MNRLQSYSSKLTEGSLDVFQLYLDNHNFCSCRYSTLPIALTFSGLMIVSLIESLAVGFFAGFARLFNKRHAFLKLQNHAQSSAVCVYWNFTNVISTIVKKPFFRSEITFRYSIFQDRYFRMFGLFPIFSWQNIQMLPEHFLAQSINKLNPARKYFINRVLQIDSIQDALDFCNARYTSDLYCARFIFQSLFGEEHLVSCNLTPYLSRPILKGIDLLKRTPYTDEQKKEAKNILFKKPSLFSSTNNSLIQNLKEEKLSDKKFSTYLNSVSQGLSSTVRKIHKIQTTTHNLLFS